MLLGVHCLQSSCGCCGFTAIAARHGAPPNVQPARPHPPPHAAEKWRTDDMVDCMLSYAATHLVDEMTDVHSVEGMDMLERIRAGEQGGNGWHATAFVWVRCPRLKSPAAVGALPAQ